MCFSHKCFVCTPSGTNKQGKPSRPMQTERVRFELVVHEPVRRLWFVDVS